jgi:hypothetical protein
LRSSLERLLDLCDLVPNDLCPAIRDHRESSLGWFSISFENVRSGAVWDDC